MLNGKIEILAYLGLVRDHIYDLIGDLFGICIKQSDPLDIFYRTKLSQKLGKCFVSVDIFSVKSSLLRNEYEFLNSARGKSFCFFHKIVHGNATIRTPDIGNDAVCASLITAFRNLEISVMSAGSETSVRIRKRNSIKRSYLFDLFVFFSGGFVLKNFIKNLCDLTD